MMDVLDASEDRLRLAVARALATYGEDELFECLTDAEPIVRSAAARVLQVRGTDRTFEHASDLTKHSRHEMREMAAFILGQLGAPDYRFATRSFPMLARLLRDPYWEVRRAAAGSIGTLSAVKRPEAEIRDAMIEVSSDASPDVRASVAAALGTIDDEKADECLERLRDDLDPVVRDDAEFAIEMRETLGLAGRTAAQPAAAE